MAQTPAPKFSGRWRELHTDVVASMDEPTKSDLRLIDRFVQNLSTAEAVMVAALDQPYVAGSTGQLTEHPGFKVAARCDGQALSLARQLKLTPFVRSNATAEDTDEDEDNDPILRARDDLAARRRTRAA